MTKWVQQKRRSKHDKHASKVYNSLTEDFLRVYKSLSLNPNGTKCVLVGIPKLSELHGADSRRGEDVDF